MLKLEEFLKACEASLKRAAERHGIELLEVAVMSDHVHVVAQLRADASPARAAMLLKDASAGFVVSNAVLPELSVNVDECVGLMGEEIGFEASALVCAERRARVNAPGIAGGRPVREARSIRRFTSRSARRLRRLRRESRPRSRRL